MRMWMVKPKLMCRKHLLGEHVEIHMFVGTLKKKKSVDGYLKNNLLEPLSLFKRHNELVNEMISRGYNHNSPLEEDFSIMDYLTNEQKLIEVDYCESYNQLITRCNQCKKD